MAVDYIAILIIRHYELAKSYSERILCKLTCRKPEASQHTAIIIRPSRGLAYGSARGTVLVYTCATDASYRHTFARPCSRTRTAK
eukprot:1640704-Pyramimonas_sp.AAC.1